MEPKDNILFTRLEVDFETTPNLKELASWSKFIAITGMCFAGIALVFALTMGGRIESALNSGFMDSGANGFLGILIILFFSIACFVLSTFLYKFASKMQSAIATSDKYEFTESIKNLKNTYKFTGILFSIYILYFLVNFIVELTG